MENNIKKSKFKLLVKDTGEASLSLLQYINDNIDIIMKMGVTFDIVKINQKSITQKRKEEMAKKGITMLPAIVTENGVVLTKVSRIINKFNKNIEVYQQMLEEDKKGTNNKIEKCSTFGDSSLDEYYAGLIDKDNSMDNENELTEDTTKTNYDQRLSEINSRRKAQTENRFGQTKNNNSNKETTNRADNKVDNRMNVSSKRTDDVDVLDKLEETEEDDDLSKNIKVPTLNPSEDSRPDDFMFEQAFLMNASASSDY
jgi:hypothetical protein